MWGTDDARRRLLDGRPAGFAGLITLQLMGLNSSGISDRWSPSSIHHPSKGHHAPRVNSSGLPFFIYRRTPVTNSVSEARQMPTHNVPTLPTAFRPACNAG